MMARLVVMREVVEVGPNPGLAHEGEGKEDGFVPWADRPIGLRTAD